MYAIVEAGGHQVRVEAGTQFIINQVETAVGKPHVLKHVLMASDGGKVYLGQPYLKGATVVCEVLDHRKGAKTISYKFRRRENYRKTRGHRQQLSKLLVKEIALA